MKFIIGILLILSSTTIFALDEKSNTLYNGIDNLEQALKKLGEQSLDEKRVKVGSDETLIPNIKFDRIGLANNDDTLKKFIVETKMNGVDATLYIINPNDQNQLIPITTTALDFRGAKQIGKMNALDINSDLQKVIQNKSKICAKELVVPTKGIAFQSTENNYKMKKNLKEKLAILRKESFQSQTFPQEEKALLENIKKLEENPSRCKVRFDYCAKPIHSSNGQQTLGVYFIQAKSKNNSKCSENKYPMIWNEYTR